MWSAGISFSLACNQSDPVNYTLSEAASSWRTLDGKTATGGKQLGLVGKSPYVDLLPFIAFCEYKALLFKY